MRWAHLFVWSLIFKVLGHTLKSGINSGNRSGCFSGGALSRFGLFYTLNHFVGHDCGQGEATSLEHARHAAQDATERALKNTHSIQTDELFAFVLFTGLVEGKEANYVGLDHVADILLFLAGLC